MQHRPSSESSLCRPLDLLLASKAQVRLLRILARDPGVPLDAAELAEGAGLSSSAGRQALNRLVRTGLVEEQPEGRKRRFALRPGTPLSRELVRLFETESNRPVALVSALRRELHHLPRLPERAWLQSYLPGWGGLLEVCLHFSGSVDPELLSLLEERLDTLREELQLSLEIRTVGDAELGGVEWEGVLMVLGRSPEEVEEEEEGGADLRLNPASPEFSCALAALLEDNLSVLLRARENVMGKLEGKPNGHGQDLWEWKKILDTFSVPRLLHFLESDSPRAHRLRECSPFPEVLSGEDRQRLVALTRRPS